LKQFFITLAGVFAGLLLFFVALPLVLISMAAGAAKPAATPDATVLALDLRGGLNDQSSPGPFAFAGQSDSVMSIVRVLRRAEEDDNVKALFIRLPESGMAPAAAEELRIAIKSFRAQKKPVVAHSQGPLPCRPGGLDVHVGRRRRRVLAAGKRLDAGGRLRQRDLVLQGRLRPLRRGPRLPEAGGIQDRPQRPAQ
jgi:hypothetical protein